VQGQLTQSSFGDSQELLWPDLKMDQDGTRIN
jgi:hypothetical protein